MPTHIPKKIDPCPIHIFKGVLFKIELKKMQLFLQLHLNLN